MKPTLLRQATRISTEKSTRRPADLDEVTVGIAEEHAGLVVCVRQASLCKGGALFEFISAGTPREDLFESLADALVSLPVEEGKARVATWPVLTILPFMARPDRFMFLKPEPTKECADRMRFNLQYSADLPWLTYHKLMEMSDDLLERLRLLGARDYIDVQSFIWVVAKY